MWLKGRKQSGERNLSRYICGGAAVLASAALFLFIFRWVQGSPEWQDVKILVFGDSVLGEVRDGTGVPAQLEALLGEKVYNAALGGTCAARGEQDRHLDYSRGAFSLVALLKAVEAEDFGVQQSAVVREINTDYFAEVIDGLETLNFSGTDTFVIQQGINDYQQGVPIENPEDPYDEYTYLGALRTAVDSLRRTAPGARIIFVTPLFTWYVAAGVTCETEDFGGGPLEDYVNAEIALARELGVEVIDLYHDFFPHEEWEDWQLYSKDGMHPNEAGREKMALEMAEYLRE